jgi:hypothetical protein
LASIATLQMRGSSGRCIMAIVHLELEHSQFISA